MTGKSLHGQRADAIAIAEHGLIPTDAGDGGDVLVPKAIANQCGDPVRDQRWLLRWVVSFRQASVNW